MAAVTVWLNAFIPKNVAGYTLVVASGTGGLAGLLPGGAKGGSGMHAGKTAVPLPKTARLNPINLIKNFDAGYLTDQRSFDTLESASSRMHSLAEVTLFPPGSMAATRLSKDVHESSGTTEVDMVTGSQLGFARADMSRCSWTLRDLGSTVCLDLKGAADDPLVSVAADIDYEGTFTFTLDPSTGAVTVEFDGKLDQFPAFECYARVNNVVKTLFTAPPPAGNTVMSLPGPANRPFKGKVTFP